MQASATPGQLIPRAVLCLDISVILCAFVRLRTLSVSPPFARAMCGRLVMSKNSGATSAVIVNERLHVSVQSRRAICGATTSARLHR